MTLLAVERIKLVSTRSPWWCTVVTLVLRVGFTALFVGFASADAVTVPSTQFSYQLGLVVMMVMAALAVTTEYRFGTIRSTFVAVPNRSAVLVAKAAMVALVAGVVGEVAAFLSWGLALLIKPTADLGLDTSAHWRQVAGVGLVYALAAVLAVGVAALVRQSAGAIAILLVYTLVVEALLPLIPKVGDAIRPWLPLRAADWFLTAGPGPSSDEVAVPDAPYGPWVGLLYFAAVSLVLLAVAMRVVEKRDA